MDEQGWDVHIVSSPDEGLRFLGEQEPVTCHSLSMARKISIAADIRALWAWTRLLRRVRPDVLNVGTPKAGLIGSVAAWLTRVPKRVYVVRGLRLESESGLRRKLLSAMERVAIACSTDVIAVSESLRAEMVRQGLARTGVITVVGSGSSNGVDAAAISARVESVDRIAGRQVLGLSDSDFVIIFVGRLCAAKGINELARAVARPELASVRLLTLGDLDDGEAEAALRALGDRWIRLEWTTDVAGVLALGDVFCLPTHREGFPNVALEAAAAKLAVVTTSATGARDSVIDGETGLVVDVGDHHGLVKALTSLAADPVQRRRMGEAGYERVVRDFTSDAIWRGLADIYRRPVTNRGRARRRRARV